jgi:hypothetical protein
MPTSYFPALSYSSHLLHLRFPPVPDVQCFFSMLLPSVHAVLSWYTSMPAALEFHGLTFGIQHTPSLNEMPQHSRDANAKTKSRAAESKGEKEVPHRTCGMARCPCLDPAESCTLRSTSATKGKGGALMGGLDVCANSYSHITRKLEEQAAQKAAHGGLGGLLVRYVSITVDIFFASLYHGSLFLFFALFRRRRIDRLDKEKLVEVYARLQTCSKAMGRLRKHYLVVAFPIKTAVLFSEACEDAMEKFILVDAVHDTLQQKDAEEGEWVDWRKVLRPGV